MDCAKCVTVLDEVPAGVWLSTAGSMLCNHQKMESVSDAALTKFKLALFVDTQELKGVHSTH